MDENVIIGSGEGKCAVVAIVVDGKNRVVGQLPK